MLGRRLHVMFTPLPAKKVKSHAAAKTQKGLRIFVRDTRPLESIAKRLQMPEAGQGGSARPQQDFPRLIGLYRSGRLKLDQLITRTYTIEEAPQSGLEYGQ